MPTHWGHKYEVQIPFCALYLQMPLFAISASSSTSCLHSILYLACFSLLVLERHVPLVRARSHSSPSLRSAVCLVA